MGILETALELNDRLVAARRQHRQAEHALAVALAELEERSLYRALGYASLGEYAAVALDMTPRQARDLARIGRHLPNLPCLSAALSGGELDWTKARELVSVATPETEEAWVERAKQVSSRVLEQDVSRTLRGEAPPEGIEAPKGPARRRVVFEMEASDAEILFTALAVARARADIRGAEVEDGALLAGIARGYVEAGDDGEPASDVPYRIVVEHCPECGRNATPDAEVSDTVVEEARCDAEVIDLRPGPGQGHAAHTIAPTTRRKVLGRDHWRCAVPGCRNRVWLHLHHLEHRALGGGNGLENLVTCCSFHHRAIHAGVLALEVRADGALVVTHADGRRLAGPARAPHVGGVGGPGARQRRGGRLSPEGPAP